VQKYLFGFIKEEVIPPYGRHHIAKFDIDQESPPPPSPLEKRNPVLQIPRLIKN
jgi:hypothetical protein